MVYLIASLSTGQGSWALVTKMIHSREWTKVILVCNKFAYEKFTIQKENVVKVCIDEQKRESSIDGIVRVLKDEVKDIEVMLNITSGTGNEHMIILASLLRAGLAMNLCILEEGKVKEVTIFENQFVYDYENVI